jgi:phage baseplate assembly protein W
MTPQNPKAFLGVGWASPLAVDTSGNISLAAYEEDVRQAILIILGTAKGERVMRPDFGAGLKTLVFEPINTTTMALIKVRVQEALVQWEPRIDQVAVDVTAGQRALGQLNIGISYRIRSTNTFYNIVYPFYLTEGTEGS